jgi:hypothetical protein
MTFVIFFKEPKFFSKKRILPWSHSSFLVEYFIDKAGKQKYHKAALQNCVEKHSYCGYYRMVINTTLEGFMKSFVRKNVFCVLMIALSALLFAENIPAEKLVFAKSAGMGSI